MLVDAVVVGDGTTGAGGGSNPGMRTPVLLSSTSISREDISWYTWDISTAYMK